MTNNIIEEESEELKQNRKFYKEEVVNRILGIAALKSLINDASGETELIKKAVSKLNNAFGMEEYYLEKVKELEKKEYEARLAEQTTEENVKKTAKEILGIGGKQ